jgi:hypothetical protein
MFRARVQHQRCSTFLAISAGLLALLTAGSARAQVSETTFTWGGYVKLDMIYSTGSAGTESSVVDFILVPGAVPIDAGDQRNFHLSARESRLWFRTSTPSPLGNVDTHTELDFLGFDTNLGSEVSSNASSLRLRHAFGTWNIMLDGQSQGALLAGQTWTTIMDLDALPDIIDFGSPAGRVFGQQSQIRYTRNLGGGSEVQVSIENPENTLRINDAANPDTHGDQLSPRPQDDLAPDTIAKYRLSGPWGHVAAAGITRLLRQKDEYGASDDTDVGFGAHVSGKIMIGPKNNLRFDASYGRGLGRYMVFGAFPDGEVWANGKIDPTDIAGGILSGQVFLTDTIRANVAFSYAQALNNDEALAGIANERLLTTHANVMWSPTASLRLGIEHIYAQRWLEDDGAPAGADLTGNMHRVQTAIRFTF